MGISRRAFVIAGGGSALSLVSGCLGSEERSDESTTAATSTRQSATTRQSTTTEQSTNTKQTTEDVRGWLRVSNYTDSSVEGSVVVTVGSHESLDETFSLRADGQTTFDDAFTETATYEVRVALSNGTEYSEQLSADFSESSGWRGARVSIKSTKEIDVVTIRE